MQIERTKRPSLKKKMDIQELMADNFKEQPRPVAKKTVSEAVSGLVKKIGEVNGVNAIEANRKLPLDGLVRKY